MPISPSIAATTSATEIAVGQPGQAVAAGGAAGRGHQPGMRQRLQQLGDGRRRQPGRGGDRSRRLPAARDARPDASRR